MSAPAPAVELEAISRLYHVDEVTATALEDMSLTVAAGEFTVILGPSGSGKTTAQPDRRARLADGWDPRPTP
ncbi:MAG: ATP-binding cassette domain-containing protein [Gaiellaceae bacterium]